MLRQVTNILNIKYLLYYFKLIYEIEYSGLAGNPTLLEIGGPAFLLPTVQKNKLYDIQQLLNHLQYKEDSFVVGAGAGPWPYLNSNCEV